MLTPIEKHEGIYFKRDDLFEINGVRGGKVRSCYALAKDEKHGLVTAGSRQSPQVNIVAHVGQYLGLPVRVHTPTGELSPEVLQAKALGAEVIQHKYGYNSVIIKRARDDAKEHGYLEIPFGMECDTAIYETSMQVENIPTVKRIVMPVGSGMSLAGVLHGLNRFGLDIPVFGVVVGADPTKRLDKYAPQDWRERVTLVNAGIDYHKHAPELFLAGVKLDPIYEAKCIPFVEEGDLLWVVGIRATA
jgi:1-aminocyclopropane-1-carboxylate deaminase/D-cysteine desulfhydrase-like pyridoxal-dependent ACC family enzyme